MNNISTIEDKLIDVISKLGLFKYVGSQGRGNPPEILNYPVAFVYFLEDADTGSNPRPVYDLIFEVLVSNKNVQAEVKAAKNTYILLDKVRDVINKKSFGISDIEPFTCISRQLAEYKDGIISYKLRFKTRHYLAVPVETV